MSKQFKFNNGYIGTLPDAVAETLEKRKEGKIVVTEPVQQTLLQHRERRDK